MKVLSRTLATLVAVCFIGVLLWVYIEAWGLGTLLIILVVIIICYWAIHVLSVWYVEARNARSKR